VFASLAASSSVPYAFAKKREGDSILRMLRRDAARTAWGLHTANRVFIYLRTTTSPSRACRIFACSMPMSPVILRFQTRRVSCGIIRNRRESEQEGSVYLEASGTHSHPHAESHYRQSHATGLPSAACTRIRKIRRRDAAISVSRAGIERKRAPRRIADFLSASLRDSKSRGISNFAGSASRAPRQLFSLLFCWRLRLLKVVELDL